VVLYAALKPGRFLTGGEVVTDPDARASEQAQSRSASLLEYDKERYHEVLRRIDLMKSKLKRIDHDAIRAAISSRAETTPRLTVQHGRDPGLRPGPKFAEGAAVGGVPLPAELLTFNRVAGASAAFVCMLSGPNSPPQHTTLAIFLGDPHTHGALLTKFAKWDEGTYDKNQTCGIEFESNYFDDKKAFLEHEFPSNTWGGGTVFAPKLVQWAMLTYPRHRVFSEYTVLQRPDTVKYTTPLDNEFNWMAAVDSDVIQSDTRYSQSMSFLRRVLHPNPTVPFETRFDQVIGNLAYDDEAYARELFTCFMTYGIDPRRLRETYPVDTDFNATSERIEFPVSDTYILIYTAHWQRVTEVYNDFDHSIMNEFFLNFVAGYFVQRWLLQDKYSLEQINEIVNERKSSQLMNLLAERDGDSQPTSDHTDAFVSTYTSRLNMPTSQPVHLVHQLEEEYQPAAIAVICAGCRSVKESSSRDPNYVSGVSVFYDIVTGLHIALECGYRKREYTDSRPPGCIISTAGSSGGECSSFECIDFMGQTISHHIGAQLRILRAIGAIGSARGGGNYHRHSVASDIRWHDTYESVKDYACSTVVPKNGYINLAPRRTFDEDAASETMSETSSKHETGAFMDARSRATDSEGSSEDAASIIWHNARSGPG